MTAFLGMYDPAPLRAANDRFWQAIRARLGAGPASLDRDRDPWQIWTDPGLVLAQTCGYPYRARLHGRVRLVGTPDYGLPGCPPGHYCSVLVVRDTAPLDGPDALDGARLAYNEALSQSGWAAPMTYLAGRVTLATPLRTGSHAASAAAVAEGRADVAALDALTWDLLQAHDPGTGRLREIGRTPPTPGLPYITATRNDPARIARAVETAIDDLTPQDRAALHLHGLVRIPAEAYLAIPSPPPPPA